MRIIDLLRKKGSAVATVPPNATVSEVITALVEHRVGALIVSPDGASISGIVSERDVVRGLHERGAAVLGEPVTTLMTTAVRTCRAADDIDSLTLIMTEHRIRHVPVVDADGRLDGIVSIGDVVKKRIDELENEREALVDYITTGR